MNRGSHPAQILYNIFQTHEEGSFYVSSRSEGWIENIAKPLAEADLLTLTGPVTAQQIRDRNDKMSKDLGGGMLDDRITYFTIALTDKGRSLIAAQKVLPLL